MSEKNNRQSVNNSAIRMSTMSSEHGRMSTHSSGNNTRVSSVNNPNNIDWKVGDANRDDITAHNWVTVGNQQAPVTFNDLELYGNGTASQFDNNPITVHNKQLELIDNYRRLKTNVRCVNSCTIFFLVIAFLLIGVVAAASLLTLHKIDRVESQTRNQENVRMQLKQSLNSKFGQLHQTIPEINKTIAQNRQFLEGMQQQYQESNSKISQLHGNITETVKSLNEKTSSLEEIKSDVESLKQKNKNAANYNQSIMDQIQAIDNKIDNSDLQSQLDDLKTQMEDLVKKITALETKITELETSTPTRSTDGLTQ